MDEPRHPVGPEIDDSPNPTAASPEEYGSSPSADAADAAMADTAGAPPEPVPGGSADPSESTALGGEERGPTEAGATDAGATGTGTYDFGATGAGTTDAGTDHDSGSAQSTESSRRSINGRDMLTQLQQMIDTLAVQATPVIREVAAKAAELAAVAGEKAGPLAHRAAEATEKVGGRVAARSKEMASELRRAQAQEARVSPESQPEATPGNEEAGG
ncbi:MAG TPA: hypothetical protein VK992_06605 [Candidatus Caenarcaniphilales bacterium]|nr:hypothetical protein [Candidatus Caenarcaniphilales bacterium]